MSDCISGLIGGIVEFILDVVLLRKVREARKRPQRSWQEDAADVAYVDWWLVPVSCAMALACGAALHFGLGLSLWISFGVPVALAGFYCVYRYLELFRR